MQLIVSLLLVLCSANANVRSFGSKKAVDPIHFYPATFKHPEPITKDDTRSIKGSSLRQSRIAKENCRPEIHMMHVQDSSSTFRTVIKDLRDNQILERLVNRLSTKYSSVKYGLTTFSDKPAPLVGYGSGWATWRPDLLGDIPIQEDSCYDVQLPLADVSSSEASLSVIQDAWGRVGVAGGKDAEENQFDALARAAEELQRSSPASHNADGKPILRLAFLVTDDFAHAGTDDPDMAGDGDSFSATYKGKLEYYTKHFGDFKMDIAYFGCVICQDLSLSTLRIPIEEQTMVSVDAWYRAFVLCMNIDQEEEMRAFGQQRWDELTQFISLEFNAAGVPNISKSYVREEWRSFCSENHAEVGKSTGIFAPFANKILPVEKEAIHEYPYDQLRKTGEISDNCTEFEYPDPADSRYAEIFKETGVLPVVVVTPPSYDMPHWEEISYWQIANHCASVFDGEPVNIMLWDQQAKIAGMQQCYESFYRRHLESLQANGVESLLQVMQLGDPDAEALIDSLESLIDSITPTLTCEDPTTTTTTTEETITPVEILTSSAPDAVLPIGSRPETGDLITEGVTGPLVEDSSSTTAVVTSPDSDDGSSVVAIAAGSIGGAACLVAAAYSSMHVLPSIMPETIAGVGDVVDVTAVSEDAVTNRETFQVVEEGMYL